MIRFSYILAMTVMLGACAQLQGLQTQFFGGDAQAKAQNITRQMVVESDLALIKIKLGETDQVGSFLLAVGASDGAATYGKNGRGFVTMRGGQMTGLSGAGFDLVGVAPNAADPVQNQRALSNWPLTINRQYRLPGPGLDEDVVRVKCQIEIGARTSIVILDYIHNVTSVTETCRGDETIINRYWVADSGYIWKSFQYAGQNDFPMIIEIVEPLDV